MTQSLLEARRFTPAEAAQQLGVTEATLANWRSTRRGPVAMKLGRRVWYFAEDVEAFLQERRKYAAQKTGPVLALPLQAERPAVCGFNRITGHRGLSKGRATNREG